MTTWNSRIILRNDSDWAQGDENNVDFELARGEVGAKITDSYMEVRVGVAEGGAPFSDCVLLIARRIDPDTRLLTVEVPAESGLADGTLLVWDPSTSRFVPEAQPIAFSSAASGALTYTASTDRWTADTNRLVPDLVDGGTFVTEGSEAVAPSFTDVPTIGEPTP